MLDDLPMLYQIADAAKADAYLFKPEDAYRMPGGGRGGGAAVGQNPPNGAIIFYQLKSRPSSEVTLEILDSAGKLVKKFSNLPVPGGLVHSSIMIRSVLFEVEIREPRVDASQLAS